MLKLDLQFFAKFTASFSVKGELDMDRVVVYEVKNKGKQDEYIETVDLLSILKEFNGQEVSITVKRDEEVYSAKDIAITEDTDEYDEE